MVCCEFNSVTPCDDFIDAEHLLKQCYEGIRRILSRDVFGQSKPAGAHFGPQSIAQYEAALVDGFRSKLDPVVMRKTASMSTEEFIVTKGFVDKDKVNLAGILFFTKHPTIYYKGAWTQCSRYFSEGKSKERIRQDIDGPITDQLQGILEFILSNTNTITIPTQDLMRAAKEPQYPMTAIREIVANALCHRDYNDHEQIHVYSDLFRQD